MKVAIWGAGKMGWVHAEAYKKLSPDVRIGAVIEADQEKGRRFGECFRCEWYESMEDVPEAQIDAIDICLPTHMHCEAILQSLKYCSYILCEKPICLHEDEYRELFQKIKAEGSCVMVGQVLRFWNGYQKVKELLEAGTIGTPTFISCVRQQKMPQWSNGNWLMDTGKSGGLLMDLCIHDVDYVGWIMGMPDRVACETVSREDGTNLHSLITLGYKACSVQIVGSWGMPSAFNEGELLAGLEIVGNAGMITYDGANHIKLISDGERKEIILEEQDGYEQEIAYFAKCVNEKKLPAAADISSVETTMRILWAAKEACDTGGIMNLCQTAGSKR